MNITIFNTSLFLSQMYLPRLWLLSLRQRLVLFSALARSLNSIIPEGLSITVVITFIVVVVVIIIVIKCKSNERYTEYLGHKFPGYMEYSNRAPELIAVTTTQP